MNFNEIVLNVIISYDGCDWSIGMKICYSMSYNDYSLKIKMSIRMELYYGASILTAIVIGQLEWNCIMDNPFN